MFKRCFCGQQDVELEHATYAINGTPRCDTDCYEEALEAQGIGIHHVVMVTVRRPAAEPSVGVGWFA